MQLTGFGSLAGVPEERMNEHTTRKFVSGEKGMLVWWNSKAGANFTAHKHPHEQFVVMLKGKLDIRIGKERRVMAPGDIAVIPGGVEHEGTFVEDSEVLDVFAPPREDFIAGTTPDYIRHKA